jgi:hypothetical protein
MKNLKNSMAKLNETAWLDESVDIVEATDPYAYKMDMECKSTDHLAYSYEAYIMDEEFQTEQEMDKCDFID